jgi:hypothetical protein
MPAKMKAAAKPLNSRQSLQAELRALTRQRDQDKKITEKAALKIERDKTRELTRIDRLIADAAKKYEAVVRSCDRAATNLTKHHAKTNQALNRRIAVLASRLAAL